MRKERTWGVDKVLDEFLNMGVARQTTPTEARGRGDRPETQLRQYKGGLVVNLIDLDIIYIFYVSDES